jgi:hypothetical protein
LLKYVSGSVTIEAWNSDFNCSKLVSQWYDGIIHNLYCNGTNNATTVRSNASHGLSDNAWAGIGVSIGVIATGAIIAVVWLFLHYRRRRNRGNKTTSEPEKQVEVQSPDLSGLHEAEPVGVVREAPDGALYELAVLPAEKPDDHLKEMPSPEICQLAR